MTDGQSSSAVRASFVDPSTSVNSSVTTPVGGAAACVRATCAPSSPQPTLTGGAPPLRTSALQPPELTSGWEAGELPKRPTRWACNSAPSVQQVGEAVVVGRRQLVDRH